MAKQRYVKTQFWDKKYIRSLPPLGKLAYLYLFTGPLATISGAYEITASRIAWDTGLTEIEVDAWLHKFKEDGKVDFRDDWIVVFNTIEHQNNTTPTIRRGIEESVKCCPDWIKDSLSIRYEWLSHFNLNSNLNSNLKNGGVSPLVVAAEAAAETDDLWTKGVKLLTAQGSPERSARSLLGRLAKQYTEPELAAAIDATLAENPIEPTSFLIGVLKKRSKDKAGMYVGASAVDDEMTPLAANQPCGVCGREYCLLLHRDDDATPHPGTLAGPS